MPDSLKLVSISPLILECSECPKQFNTSGGGEVLIGEIVRHMLDRHPEAASEFESEEGQEAANRLLYDIKARRLL